jgi:hypothetical protein
MVSSIPTPIAGDQAIGTPHARRLNVHADTNV